MTPVCGNAWTPRAEKLPYVVRVESDDRSGNFQGAITGASFFLAPFCRFPDNIPQHHNGIVNNKPDPPGRVLRKLTDSAVRARFEVHAEQM